MSNGYTTAVAEATQRAHASDGLLERLADRMGGRTDVQAVFGEPVERNGVTIIPVARVRWGFGAGSGSGPSTMTGDGTSSGSSETATTGGTGGGGMAGAMPVGYIEIDTTGARFRPIVDPYPSPVFLLAVGVMTSMVLRGLARLLRG